MRHHLYEMSWLLIGDWCRSGRRVDVVPEGPGGCTCRRAILRGFPSTGPAAHHGIPSPLGLLFPGHRPFAQPRCGNASLTKVHRATAREGLCLIVVSGASLGTRWMPSICHVVRRSEFGEMVFLPLGALYMYDILGIQFSRPFCVFWILWCVLAMLDIINIREQLCINC